MNESDSNANQHIIDVRYNNGHRDHIIVKKSYIKKANKRAKIKRRIRAYLRTIRVDKPINIYYRSREIYSYKRISTELDQKIHDLLL